MSQWALPSQQTHIQLDQDLLWYLCLRIKLRFLFGIALQAKQYLGLDSGDAVTGFRGDYGKFLVTSEDPAWQRPAMKRFLEVSKTQLSNRVTSGFSA